MRPNGKRLGAAVAALILGAIGVVTLVRYVQTAEDRALAGQQLVDVVVVTQPVKAGTDAAELTPIVEVRQVPATTRTPGALSDLADVEGLVTSVDLVPGEQLLAARFEDGSIRRVAGGEVTIPDGLVEMTIQVAPPRGVGGQIVPGDKVAVVTYIDDITPGDNNPDPASGVLLRQALITNIQSAAPESLTADSTDRSRQAPGVDLLVTLAIEPSHTERLVFAQEFGRIWLARESEGPAIDSGDLILLDSLFEGGLAQALENAGAESLAATEDGATDATDGADAATEADTVETEEEQP